MLAIRVTRSFSDLRLFFEKLFEACEKLVVFEHVDASRIHIHALIVECRVSTDTLKNWIKQVVGPVNKTDWSFLEKDVNEQFITYMTKGVLEPVAVKGYAEEEIYVYRKAWVPRDKKKKQERITYVVKETVEQRKLRQEDMINEIVLRINKICETRNLVSTREVIQLIYQVVAIENKNMLGRYKLRDYYDTVTARTDPNSWVMAMENICKKDYF